MRSLQVSIAPLNVNGDALVAVDRFMTEQNYTARCRADAKTILRRTGCVADLVPIALEPEHVAAAEALYVAALPDVHPSDPSWSDRGVWIDVESLFDAARRIPRSATIVPPELEDDFGDDIPFLVD